MTTTPTRLCDTHDMVVVHRAFRREFRLLPDIVESVSHEDVARAAEVADHADDLMAVLHDHHHGEDLLLWPKLEARAEPDRDLVQRMERQHATVAIRLDHVGDLLATWRESAYARTGAELGYALHQLSDALDEHLAEEEREILPIVERHITQAEWNELARHGLTAQEPPRTMRFLAYILEEASPAEHASMMAKLPPEAREAFERFAQPEAMARLASLRRDLTPPFARGLVDDPRSASSQSSA